MSDKIIIGLTGKSCSGKDEAARILSERGWEIIDVDGLGHQALVQRKEELVRHFGERILDSKGTVDRRVLGEIVFADSSELRALEAIVHPEMRQRVKDIIASGSGPPKVASDRGDASEGGGIDKNSGGRASYDSFTGKRKICINAALLFHMDLHRECDGVFLIAAPLVLRFIRAKKRDNLPARHIIRRFAGQRALFPKYLRKDVDMYTVRNCGSRRRLKKRLEIKIAECCGQL
ncbi:MAG: dephospho-CoA kinase [Spirochaetia bacterium]